MGRCTVWGSGFGLNVRCRLGCDPIWGLDGKHDPSRQDQGVLPVYSLGFKKLRV